MILCPNCNQKLIKNECTYICENGHSFDIAKEGYVNLLLGNKKIGDDKMMVEARKLFLEKSYYLPLIQKVSLLVKDHFKKKHIDILDLGCGEGWYMRTLQQLRNHSSDSYLGIDISKDAIKYASKNTKGTFIVGNVHTLPLHDNSYDLVISIFSPYSEPEVNRILKKDGIAIIVGPGPDHLYKFIEMIRDKPHKHILKKGSEKYSLLNFHSSYSLTIPISLSTQKDIQNLFAMTPYYRKAPKQKQERIMSLQQLDIIADFTIDLVYKDS